MRLAELHVERGDPTRARLLLAACLDGAEDLEDRAAVSAAIRALPNGSSD
ncbi:hypothetical protein ACTG9Q_27170 [Actinokineospora sp. 24-640]